MIFQIQKTFETIAKHEEKLSRKLLDYLNGKEKVKIIGNTDFDKEKRVPTISFIHDDLKSDEIVETIDEYRIGIRYGDFYAKKIIQDYKLAEKNGVVRVSLVHYNSIDEVKRLIWALGKVL